jgi:uncharacterized protein YfaS (alpha-2-macroglobulin family)
MKPNPVPGAARLLPAAIVAVLRIAFLALAPSASVLAQDAADAGEHLPVQYHPRYHYDNTSRTPVFTFHTPFELEPAAVARHLHFADADGKVVPARIRQASAEEIAAAWRSFGPNGTDSPPAPQFLAVEPTVPLPVGNHWRLVVAEGLTDASGKRRLAKPFVVSAGSVSPFKVRNIIPEFPYNDVPRVEVGLSKEIDPALRDLVGNYISIDPRPESLKFVNGPHTVSMFGDFELDRDYKVRVKAGLLAQDGTELGEPVEQTLRFHPRDAFVTLPDHEVAQPLSGEGAFQIRHGNLKNLEIRVKELRGDALVYALRGYRIYDPETTDWRRGQRYPAAEMVPGPTVFSEDRPSPGGINRTHETALDWGDVLQGARPAALYLSVEGDAADFPGMSAQRVGAQSIVQLTDLGLIWKQNGKDALAYVFSLRTGKPVPAAEVRLVDDDSVTVAAYKTGDEGLAAFPLGGANAKARWLLVSKDQDRYAAAFDPASRQGISTWSFDVRQPYWGEPDLRLRTFLFSDRGVYRPGETVHLKAVARTADGDRLRVPGNGEGQGFAARLTVEDSRGRTVVDRPVAFGERGTADVSFDLPEGSLGTYTAALDFDALLGKATFDGEEEDHYDRYAYHYFSVAEYRPNTFEIHLSHADAYGLEDEIRLPVSANYFRGKPLADTPASWFAAYEGTTFAPAGFDGYRFGIPREDLNGNEAGEVTLGDKGDGEVVLDFIPRDTLEQPVRVRAEVSVTDLNQQTLTKSSSFLVHSSDVYVGLKLPGGWKEAGQPIRAEMIPVRRDGTVSPEALDGTLTVERRVYRTVKVQGADQTERYRNEEVFEPVLSEAVRVAGTLDAPASKEVVLREPGQYRFTLAARTAGGKSLASEGWCYVWGDGDVYWAHRDGDAIELAPEAEAYTVGDTARITVRSPILGTALITTERGGVYRTFVRELTSKNEVVELPVTAQDAPNLFVSAIVVRGSQDSTHKFRDTEYKLGYCEIRVDQPATRLDVVVEVPAGDVMPRQDVTAGVLVRDASGKPVPGAEVTLYAVDEGVLSLTGYETPDPGTVFHEAYPLYVRTWHSIFNLLSEDPEQRPFGNKGLLIGGGDDGLSGLRDRSRKDFRATAFWNPGLVTDAAGRATATFTAPDNLTGFKVFAVVVGDTERYGAGTAKLSVNKPVIVEPALPAFANIGDELILQAVARNTTGQGGRFEVTLLADETVSLAAPGSEVVPIALGNAAPGPREWKRTVDLAPGQSTALPIPVTFQRAGEAKWTWTIRELDAPGQGVVRSDSVESTFQVGYPVPLLGETRTVRLEAGQGGDLLASLGSRELLNGFGRIDATISNSRMLDALDALEYNLQYPYGCVEQTTSSTLPWLTMTSLERVFPSLSVDPEKKSRAIRHGLNRILSMQTGGGGLAYWPGGEEPEFWASAYGGLALALGAKQVPGLPANRLDQLWTWLTEQLREAEAADDPSDLHQRCLALYTLALAGKADAAYQEVLYKKQALLAPESRAVLALAILESGNPAQASLAAELLGPNRESTAPEHAVSWYGPAMPVAAKLMAWTRIDARSPQTDQLLGQLLRLRKPRHGWGSTYANAWPLLALAKIADHEAPALAPVQGTLAFGDQSAPIGLEAVFSSRSASFAFEGDVTGRPLQWASDSSQPVYAHLRVATRPAALSAEARDAGFGIRRTYLRLSPDGSTEAADQFEVGDLVVVRLDLRVDEGGQQYLAIDDPLPAIFESVNPAFQGRGERVDEDWTGQTLPRDFEEMRTDRTLFFCNYLAAKDNYRVEYLARVVAAGTATAPPAKIEAMYEPQRHGLTATTRVTAKLPPQAGERVAAR